MGEDKNPLKILAACITSLIVITTAIYGLDSHWVTAKVYAGDMTSVKMKQLNHEDRQIRQEIYNLEDRTASPSVPESRKVEYRKRIRALKDDQKDIQAEKEALLPSPPKFKVEAVK